MRHWIGSIGLLLGACGFPSTYSLPPQYAILGKEVRVSLNWSPSQPEVRVSGALLVAQADPQSNSVTFKIPAPTLNNDGTYSGGGWGGPQSLEVKDGNRQAKGTLYVLGRSYLKASQPNTVLLLAPEGVSAKQVQGFLGQTGLKFEALEVYPLQGPGICKGSLARFKYTGDTPSFEEALRRLDERARSEPGVALAVNPQTDYDTGADYTPLDGREEVAAPAAHGRGFTGKGTVIAVLDTGVGLQSFSEWGSRRLTGRQFTAAGESEYTGDDYVGELTGEDGVPTGGQAQGHGSQVASLAAGTQFGVAPEAEVLPVKVCDQQGKCRTGDVVRGVCWALGYADGRFKGNLKPLILNLSLGGDTGDFERDILKLVLEQAIDLGVTVVTSAGNDWDDYLRGALYEPRSYPAALDLDGLIAVGAVRKPVGSETFEPSGYSNRGSWIDLLAPGSLVKAIDAYGQPRDNNRGTSFAAPLVAGAVALWRQALPDASPLELQNKILENARTDRVSLLEPDRGRLTRRFLDLSSQP